MTREYVLLLPKRKHTFPMLKQNGCPHLVNELFYDLGRTDPDKLFDRLPKRDLRLEDFDNQLALDVALETGVPKPFSLNECVIKHYHFTKNKLVSIYGTPVVTEEGRMSMCCMIRDWHVYVSLQFGNWSTVSNYPPEVGMKNISRDGT